MVLGRVRKVRGKFMVTIPKEVAEREGLKPGNTISLEITRGKGTYFGSAKGDGPSRSDDEMREHRVLRISTLKPALDDTVDPNDPIFMNIPRGSKPRRKLSESVDHDEILYSKP